MGLQTSAADVSPALLEAIRAFPARREVEHCGTKFAVSPFDFYGVCPSCGAGIKLRGLSACTEVEDVFDAVFAWMNQPDATELVRRRQEELAQDSD